MAGVVATGAALPEDTAMATWYCMDCSEYIDERMASWHESQEHKVLGYRAPKAMEDRHLWSS